MLDVQPMELDICIVVVLASTVQKIVQRPLLDKRQMRVKNRDNVDRKKNEARARTTGSDELANKGSPRGNRQTERENVHGQTFSRSVY